MVTNAITSFEVKISKGEEILSLKKQKLQLVEQLSKLLLKSAKSSKGENDKLDKEIKSKESEFKALDYKILEIEYKTEVFILEQILNEDKERFEQMKIAENQLLERIKHLPMLMETLKKKKSGLHFKSDHQLKLEADELTSKYQDYIMNPSNEEGIKLLKRVDMALHNIDNRRKR
jgi:alpha-galactosidase/6-phospho-beta-glucosidase family protein